MHKFCLYDKQRFKNVTLGINNMKNVQSSYYSVNDFNQRCQEISTDELLSCSHINARSLLSKVDSISNLLDNQAIRSNFIAITETWSTQSNKSLVSIDEHDFASKERLFKSGCGVDIFIDKKLSFALIDVDKYVTFEFIVLRVDYSPTSKNILAAIY